MTGTMDEEVFDKGTGLISKNLNLFNARIVIEASKIDESVLLAMQISGQNIQNEFNEEDFQDEELLSELDAMLNADSVANKLSEVDLLECVDDVCEKNFDSEIVITDDNLKVEVCQATSATTAIVFDDNTEKKKDGNNNILIDNKKNNVIKEKLQVTDEQGLVGISSEKAIENAEERKNRVCQILYDLMKKQSLEAQKEYLTYKELKKFKKARDSLRVYENYEKDLKLLELAKSTVNCSLPLYHIESTSKTIQVVNEDLSLYKMEIQILQLLDARTLVERYGSCPVCISCTIQYPDIKNFTKLTTVFAKYSNESFEFKFTKSISISRDRSLLRLAKRKIVFVIIKKSWFFIESEIGRAELKLNHLEDHVDLIKVIPIYSSTRHLIGNLRVALRLRVPLVKPQLEEIIEKKLVIDKHLVYNENNSDYAQNNSDYKAKSEPIKQVTTSGDVDRREGELKIDEIQTFFYEVDIDWVVSNAVLEEILNELNRSLTLCKSEEKKKDLLFIKEQVSLKMTVLVVMVQTGKLNPQSYVELLEKKIQEEREYASRLLSEGKKGQALNCLKRIKIMEKEKFDPD